MQVIWILLQAFLQLYYKGQLDHVLLDNWKKTANLKLGMLLLK